MAFIYNPYRHIELVEISGSGVGQFKVFCSVCERLFPKDAIYSSRVLIGEPFREMGMHIQWGHDISRTDAQRRWGRD